MFKNIINAIVHFIGNFQWKADTEISNEQKIQIRQYLGPHYFIILTWRSNHLSSYLIAIANLLFTGRFGKYSHSLMNVEDDVASEVDFRLVEAIGTGVQYSPFDSVFNVQRVCLLKPKNMSLDKWTCILDRAKTELGKPYDSLFDLKTDTALSCVELVRIALMAEPDYKENFANFEAMIAKGKNLTPYMFRACPDFEVVFEVRA